jgi:hypothetical protein
MNLKNYVIVPDMQIPHHDEGFVNGIISFIHDLNPTGVVFIGDNVDCTAPASWNKATAEEFAGTLQNEFDVWDDVAEELRNSYSGWVGVHFGNHEKRIRSYIKTKAPAFNSLRELQLENLMSLERYDFEGLPDHYDIAPGWVTHHGDYCSLSDIAGRTASNYSSKIGKSVIIGHTHRAGVIPESYGHDGVWYPRYGMEVGHAMDTHKAGYTNGVANWQKAFGILDVYNDGEFIQPRLVFADIDGKFVDGGKVYGGNV